MKRIPMILLRAVFPRRCIYCDAVIQMDEITCAKCAPILPRMEGPFCYRCGRSKTLCNCKGQRRHFDRCVAVMAYKGGVSHALLRLKKIEDADILETMTAEMVKALRRRVDAAAFDAVTFVPMHEKELRRREYNQSELLAVGVAKELGIPCCPFLVKLYETKPQKSLSLIQRSGNLLGVFDVNGCVRGQRILIVDDLITTGSTLHECAKMLKICGAASVTALTFAATPAKKKETPSA